MSTFFFSFLVVMNTDMCLIKNNAKVAAQIAVELEKLRSDYGGGEKLHVVNGDESLRVEKTKPAPVVVGGSILDVHYHVLEEKLEVSSFTCK
jgi:hypothetical protein